MGSVSKQSEMLSRETMSLVIENGVAFPPWRLTPTSFVARRGGGVEGCYHPAARPSNDVVAVNGPDGGVGVRATSFAWCLGGDGVAVIRFALDHRRRKT